MHMAQWPPVANFDNMKSVKHKPSENENAYSNYVSMVQ